MATYFDQFHSTLRRIVPNFGLLHVRAHPADPRAATSIVIACLTLCLALVVTLTLTPPARRAPPKSAEQVAPPPAADKVTIVAATPRLAVPNLDVPCAEQTWPYIDRRCLTETTQKRPEPEGRRAAAPAPAVTDTPKTPPVAAAVTPAPAETQGIAPRNTAAGATRAETPQQPAMSDDSEEAELSEDEELYPVLSPRELRRLERLERRRAAQERRMRHPHLQLPLFGRIF